MRPLQALLAQLESVPGDPRANVARAVAALEEHPNVELAVFPELYLTTYDLPSVERTALAVGGDELSELAAAASRTATAVVAGFAERLDDGRVANSAACIDRDGSLAAVYRKTQLFAREQDVFCPGEELCVVPLAGRLVAPLICFDVEFPELARSLALAGADLLVTVSANMEPYADVHELASRARALENHLPHVYVNAVGTVPPHTFVGRSRSVSATATVIAEAEAGEELLVAAVGASGAPSAAVDYLRQLPGRVPVVVQRETVGR
jgi:predicted amidohydrolase